MRVLIADSNGQRARERGEQLLIDGHDPLLAASAHAAHLKLAECPTSPCSATWPARP